MGRSLGAVRAFGIGAGLLVASAVSRGHAAELRWASPPACERAPYVIGPLPGEGTLLLDGALSAGGATLVGTLLLDDERLTVRLERQ